jgi:hypothetical protein
MIYHFLLVPSLVETQVSYAEDIIKPESPNYQKPIWKYQKHMWIENGYSIAKLRCIRFVYMYPEQGHHHERIEIPYIAHIRTTRYNPGNEGKKVSNPIISGNPIDSAVIAAHQIKQDILTNTYSTLCELKQGVLLDKRAEDIYAEHVTLEDHKEIRLYFNMERDHLLFRSTDNLHSFDLELFFTDRYSNVITMQLPVVEVDVDLI